MLTLCRRERTSLLPWDPNNERTDGGGGAPGGPWPDGEDGSTCVIMSCVESEKDSADTLKKTEKLTR